MNKQYTNILSPFSMKNLNHIQLKQQMVLTYMNCIYNLHTYLETSGTEAN